MSEVIPKFTNNGMRYTFNWAEYKLNASVSRIHPNHERTTCQLVFTSSHEDANPHLLQTTFNLTSSRSRNELAKDMISRYPIKEKIDWLKLIEYISVKSLTEFEKGEPVTEIWSSDDVAPLEYVINPIVPVGKPTIIFGAPGSGKSQFVSVLSIVMSLPWHNNKLRLIAPKQSIRPLFLDYEADMDDMRRQLKYLQNGMEVGPIPLYYRRCTIPLADDIEAIKTHLEAISANCVIVDSISLAAGGDLNKMEQATSYMRSLRQLNTTSISIAHTSKSTEGNTKTILGSILFEAGARSVWEARASAEPADNCLEFGLFHTKANLSKKFKPLGYKFIYEKESTKIEWFDPKNIAEFVERMSTNDRILTALKIERRMLSTKELVEKLEGINRNTLDQALSRLKRDNLITGNSDGWGLLAHQVDKDLK